MDKTNVEIMGPGVKQAVELYIFIFHWLSCLPSVSCFSKFGCKRYRLAVEGFKG